MEAINSERLFGEIYAALSTAPPADQTVRGIAAVRMLMIQTLGEDRQRELITLWNAALRIEPPDNKEVPFAIRRLDIEDIEALWVEAGMPADLAHDLNLLQQTMLQHVLGEAEPEAELLARLEERLQRNPRDYSMARIFGYKILAAHVMAGDSQRIIETANRNLQILAEWRAAEPDLCREYEDKRLRRIVENAAHFEAWAARVREIVRWC